MAHHQGMSLLSLAYLLLDRPMQRRFESRPLFQAVTAAAAGAHSQNHGVFSHTAELSDFRSAQRSGNADAGVQQPRHPDPGGAVVVQRPLPRDGHQCGRRLQPLEGSRRHALARRRTCDPGALLLPARCGERRLLVDRLSADAASARSTTKRFSPKGAPSFAAAITRFESYTEIVVSPEDDIELRRVRLTNRSRQRRVIESPVTPKW
jgi:cyclic beta-1,2-glucan synthetase